MFFTSENPDNTPAQQSVSQSVSHRQPFTFWGGFSAKEVRGFGIGTVLADCEGGEGENSGSG